MSHQDLQSLFRQSLRSHMDGDLAAAVEGYRRVLAASPDHVDATHYLGMAAYQQGDMDGALALVAEAERARPQDSAILANLGLLFVSAGRNREARDALERSLRIRPDQPDALLNLALAQVADGLLEKAAECYGRVLELAPGHKTARLALAQVLFDLRRPGPARRALESGLAQDPADADLRLALGQSLELGGDLNGAIDCYKQVAAQDDARRCVALTRLSTALRKRELPGSALMAARFAVWRDREDEAAWRAVGQALKEIGWLEQAAQAFRRSHRLLRAPGGTARPDLPTFSRTSRAKLRHDVQQIDYLETNGLADDTLDAVAAALQETLDALPPAVPDGQSVPLPPPLRERLAGVYNRCHHYRDTPALSASAVNPGLSAARITEDYLSRPPGLTWIDDFLTPEALNSLYRFCLESTIWYDFEHTNGYVGTYLQEGFDCDLLLQIATELPRALPDIFADHVLMQMWAYKYDSRLAGIDMHADFAAVNVNFWITPTNSNMDPESGGMVIWDKEAPADWGVDEYNTYDTDQQQRILDYLAEEGAERLRVPYRQNRCVIFDSDLFHKTDDIRFGERYEDRRINVTMLFGTRGGGIRGRRR